MHIHQCLSPILSCSPDIVLARRGRNYSTNSVSAASSSSSSSASSLSSQGPVPRSLSLTTRSHPHSQSAHSASSNNNSPVSPTLAHPLAQPLGMSLQNSSGKDHPAGSAPVLPTHASQSSMCHRQRQKIPWGRERVPHPQAQTATTQRKKRRTRRRIGRHA